MAFSITCGPLISTMKLGPADTLLICSWFGMTGTNEWLSLVPGMVADVENLVLNAFSGFYALVESM